MHTFKVVLFTILFWRFNNIFSLGGFILLVLQFGVVRSIWEKLPGLEWWQIRHEGTQMFLKNDLKAIKQLA